MIKPDAIYYGKYCLTVNTFMSYEKIICDANVIYRAYKASAKTSQWKESTQKYVLNYLRNVFSLQEELSRKTLKNSKAYEFNTNERGVVRTITSIPIKDRIVRHILCDEILLPLMMKKIIYDNGASIKGRGISFSRKRFEIHLHKYFQEHGNSGYILFGDFSKFYDNIIHEIAKDQLLELVDYDEYVSWLICVVFESFEIDVSYLSDEKILELIYGLFDKREWRKIPKEYKTGKKKMQKSINIGDQISQAIGIYYPCRIDTYVKYVRSQKYYGRYMDDWYAMSPSKEELKDILEGIRHIARELGIHINEKKTRIVKISGTYKYLQIRYSLESSGKVVKRINPKRVTGMRRKLKSLAIKVENGEIPYERVESSFKSWMGSHYKLMSKKQRKSLIELYEVIFNKSISIVKHKMIILNLTEGGDFNGS